VVPFLLVHHAGPARNADEGANDLERNGSARDHRRAGRPRGGRWQVRVALATRGRKQSAAVLGAVNAVPSVVALGQVLTHLDRPANIAGYAVGVAVGVYVGVVPDGRFADDPVEYRVVLSGDGAGPAAELRARGWPVTMQSACGLTGPATVLLLVVGAGRTTPGRAGPRAVRTGCVPHQHSVAVSDPHPTAARTRVRTAAARRVRVRWTSA